jgi:small neutral amino acid transporter SnatA (MarC family)
VTEFLQLAFYFFAAVNPAAVAGTPQPRGHALAREVIAGGALFGLAVLAAAAGLAEPILDGLGVEPETFRMGAGVVLLVSGALAVWQGAAAHQGPWEGRGAALFPLGLPVIATPAAVAAAISYGADDGAAKTMAAAAVIVAAASALLFARAGRYQAAIDGVARLTGAALVAVAAGLVVDGVRAI